MTAKQLLFGDSAQERLVRGMSILADAVGVTPPGGSVAGAPSRRWWCSA